MDPIGYKAAVVCVFVSSNYAKLIAAEANNIAANSSMIGLVVIGLVFRAYLPIVNITMSALHLHHQQQHQLLTPFSWLQPLSVALSILCNEATLYNDVALLLTMKLLYIKNARMHV